MHSLLNQSDLFINKQWFIEKYFVEVDHPLKESSIKLVLESDFVSRQIQILIELLHTEKEIHLLNRSDYFKQIKKLSLEVSQAVFMQTMRFFRHKQFIRLMLLQAAKLANTKEVMNSWSDCADAIILHTIDYCQASLNSRYQKPNAELLTLAMGKLGGRELNYSSDIDLIFAYSDVGEVVGQDVITNHQYFTKIIQQFVTVLQTVTPDGFVFRVDLRLRPNGDSGPLVSSIASLENYYQEQGRDWERYAMVKARVVSESSDQSHPWYERLIVPFVYRRYVDFSVIESLRSMKAMIEREVQLNPRLDDIKRGKGGIREVEFIIQSFQLIRGGRLPQLQKTSTLLALEVLKQERLLPRCDALKQAYLFLRQLENVLQSLNDQQTHSMPEERLKRQQICLAMGFEQWENLESKLHQYQRIISQSFHLVLGKVDIYEDKQKLLANQLANIWQGHVEESMAINLLTSMGFSEAKHCYQMIHAFRHSPRCRRLSQGARIRLDRFMVVLLNELSHFSHTDQVLLQVMHLLEHIVGRSAYLALLTENNQAIKELLFLVEKSPFIRSLLVNQPFLLEILLEPEHQWRPPNFHQLILLLEERLSHCKDIESQIDELRQFKLKNWLMAARAELYKYGDAVEIGKFLANLAEVIVTKILEIAFIQLSERYPEVNKIKEKFAIIAYGKLGSRELSYASDLDLVFLHSATSDEESLVTRLTQKILNIMTIRSQAGVLYTVDTRLRPSGLAGLLVSQVDAFIDYQQNQAWTWEHQALLKARIISNSKLIKQKFIKLKKEVLLKDRIKNQLKKEVLDMRAKMDTYQEQDPLKHSPGGLLDLEFLVQYLILSSGNVKFANKTHTLEQIRELLSEEILSKRQAQVLKSAYSHFHHLLHQNVVYPLPLQDLRIQQQVRNICDEIYEL